MEKRRFSSYKVGQTHVDYLARAQLIETVSVFCADASDQMLREFIKNLIDYCGERLEEKGYASIER